ncbi:hypothetical protein E4T56_gene14512, partial [Termitomyces sp. T112]
MAGSLAHELNQPLTAVVNYVQAAAGLLDRARTPHYDDLHHALTEAGAEALRAGMIVHHLRHFIAKGELDRTVETVRPLIDDALTLCALGIRARAPRCRVQVGPDVGPVIVDRVQIQQVLVNLLRNAAEAIGDREGRVDIKVCADDGMVRISVSDNGPGIAPELAESLFNSFTSTKIQGIGLGLSICKTIVEAHGGKIWCDGGKENGTVFHFTLPRADMEEGAELNARQINMPVILLTAHGDISTAVRAMKAGAVEFLEKPFDREKLLSAIDAAFNWLEDASERSLAQKNALNALAHLSERERE